MGAAVPSHRAAPECDSKARISGSYQASGAGCGSVVAKISAERARKVAACMEPVAMRVAEQHARIKVGMRWCMAGAYRAYGWFG
ncbi:MAG: hypothetical protein KIT19_00350 [Phycisphaeraceae bacterium]|nr:hypothetical protein [Phycisphaeraceae bacterium]